MGKLKMTWTEMQKKAQDRKKTRKTRKKKKKKKKRKRKKKNIVELYGNQQQLSM